MTEPTTMYAFDTGYGTVYRDSEEEPDLPAVFVALRGKKSGPVYEWAKRRYDEIELDAAYDAAMFFVCGGIAKGVGALDDEVGEQ